MSKPIAKVSIQLPAIARDALIPFWQQSDLAAWKLEQRDDMTLLVLAKPGKLEIARKLTVPIMIGTVTAIWSGFFIGRRFKNKEDQ